MTNLSNALWSLSTWIYRVCGYSTLRMHRRFVKDNSAVRVYSAVVALYLVAAQIYILIDSKFRYKAGNSVQRQVALCLIDISASAGAALAIMTESFIFVNKKVQLYNNFVSIHNILFQSKFTESKPLLGTNKFFVTCMLLQIILSVYTICIWGTSFYVFALLARSLVTTLMVTEILRELYCCNYYVLSLNESVLLRYAERPTIKNDIDFRATSLFSQSASTREVAAFLEEKNNAGSIEHTDIYDLLIESLNIISQRFTYTFLLTIFGSFLAFVITANVYMSKRLNTIQLISYTAWLLEFMWYLVSTSIAMELLNVQVENVIRNIGKIAVSQCKDPNPQIGVQKLLALLLRRRLILVIGGVIHVDFTFVYSVLAMTTSYIIIFIQMDHS